MALTPVFVNPVGASSNGRSWRYSSSTGKAELYTPLDWVDVRDHGAFPNSGQDETARINAAYAAANTAGVPLVFPGGDFIIATAGGLDFTDGNIGTRVTGAGGRATRLLGRNGGTIMDLTGARSITIEGLWLEADGGTPSTVGILLGRSNARADSTHIALRDLTVAMPHVAGANSSWGSVGIYNDSTEVSLYEGVEVWADVPLVFTSTSYISSIVSAHTTSTPLPSMSQVDVRSVALWCQTTDRPAVILDNAVGINFDGLYAFCEAPPTTYAFWVNGWCQNINILGHIEVYDGRCILLLDGARLSQANINLTCHQAGVASIVMLSTTTGTKLEGGSIAVRSTTGTPGAVLAMSGAALTEILGTEITLYDGQSISAASASAEGALIRSEGSVTVDLGGSWTWLDGAGGMILPEISAPAAPASNQARVFARDNGAGKSQLCVRFASGAVQVIATEP